MTGGELSGQCYSIEDTDCRTLTVRDLIVGIR